LLDHLHFGPALVLGWSDGAIEALLLGMRHPGKVVKIAAMAANLEPGANALSPEVVAYASSLLSRYLPANARSGQKASRAHKVTQLDLDEPHINPAALQAISAPTLVLAADHDMIRDEHTILIYHHLKNAQLAIFPNATHMIPFDDPALFNATVARFLDEPFVKKDRIKDFESSYQKLVRSGAMR
jgi:pimeloyl-ACP methyl ester carboxylesterase